ncbi:Uncharacterised protein [Chromobacterium violaceum]|uniref:Uncharacterized protein n=1 Tax=Chromobacterium violaceum TaxID=536 RepID=A0A3S4HV96_CHRVL|nr:Uncharacterised protein [Chromobacterium violaceum]
MHENLGLGQQRRQQRLDAGIPKLALLEVQRLAELLGAEPLRKQVQLARQQRFVVFRQHFRLAGLLDVHQGVQRLQQQVAVHERSFVMLQRREVGDLAQILHHDEALIAVAQVNLGHFYHREDVSHLDVGVGADVFRRRVHHDAACAVGPDCTEIAAEVGVGRGEFKLDFVAGVLFRQPFLELFLSLHVALSWC